MIRIVETAHGRMIVDDRDFWIGGSLIHLGEYNATEAWVLRHYATPGTMVLDVGANLGAVAVPLARHVGAAGRVVAIEPQPSVYRLLCGNCAINDLHNVECINAAASSTHGAAMVTDELAREGDSEANTGGVEVRASGPGVCVPSRLIDSLVSDRWPVSLIKVDVEGHEPQAIAGAIGTIRRCRPAVYFEADRPSSAVSVALLQAEGYRLWWHRPPLYRACNHNDAPDPFGGDYRSINLLALPKGTPPAFSFLGDEVPRA